MSEKNIIRLFFEPKALSLIDRARFIVEKQNQIGEFLNKFEWLLFDKTPVDLKLKEEVVQLFLKRMKKRIKADTTIKNIPDDYLDNVLSIDGYYASKKFDNDASFTYWIGTIDKHHNASLIIKNFDGLTGLNRYSELRKFILALIQIFQPYSIEVSEYVFYRKLMDLKSDEFWFGWMTYFSKDMKIPAAPSDIKVEELPNGGKLLITTEEFFSFESPEHVRRAKSLVELFRKNNIRA
jgi:hypothetical protein